MEMSDLYEDVFTDPVGDLDLSNTQNKDEKPQTAAEMVDELDHFLHNGESSSGNSDGENEDFISYMCRMRGIDPENIQIEEIDGVKNVKFDNLTNQDKLDVLFNDMKDPAMEFSVEEKKLINTWRNSGLTPSEFLNSTIVNEVMKYTNSNVDDNSPSIDDYTDDEVYLAQLQMDYPDLSQEERLRLLAQAKSDVDVFKKQVDNIRDKYGDQEDQDRQRRAEANEWLYNNYQTRLYNGFVNAMNSNNFLGLDSQGMVLSEEEKRDIANFAFSRDINGRTPLENAMANPENLAKIAYYTLYGRNLIDSMVEHHEEELNNALRSGYSQGFANGGGRNTVRYNSNNSSNGNHPIPKDKDGLSEMGSIY